MIFSLLAPVPTGWVQFQTSCYKIEAAAKKTWTDAKEACKAEHSDLAIIMSTEENQFVKNELMKLQITDIYMGFWMDGNDVETEGTYVWKRTGEFFTTGVKASPTVGGNENCIAFFKLWNFGWNDGGCDQPGGYVCEKHACAPGWVQFQTSCYKIEAAAKKTWTDAKEACKAEHSDLAIIMSTEENQFVKNELMKLQITDIYMGFWMDGNDVETEGTYVWKRTGELLQFYDWGQGEPNGGGNENCIAFFKLWNFGWNDGAVINQEDMCVKSRW